ncbi:sugar transferase [Dyadobacter luticola]|uniref:Sugar transferase n=1 Tax=Dyadobacter luticola TaxID=1979387 RepID=A0A5R9KPA7_9BACT|nr:sugar transferase [Dyadobacter luticola]TLU98053.1 sugar transferase [Dyadobacter luticola]
MYRKFGKRTFDIFLAVTGLIILFPLFIFLTVLLWFHFSGRPFFLQARPGKNEKVFRLIKFRSMREASPRKLHITFIGHLLRKSSLDELPQLWNVLRGDMSLVGPRPLLTEYLTLYNTEQRKRHSVSPGITGLAQVNGRNAISWEDKFAFDLWYVQNQSFKLDFEILLLTVKRVFQCRGIVSPGEVGFEKFKGSGL